MKQYWKMWERIANNFMIDNNKRPTPKKNQSHPQFRVQIKSIQKHKIQFNLLISLN